MDYFWKRILYTKKKKLWTEERKSSFFKKRRNKLDVIIFSLKQVRKTKQTVVDGNVFFHFSSTEDVWCLFSLSLSLFLFALTFFFVSSPQRKQQNKVSPTEPQQHTKPQSTAKDENNEKCASFFPLLMPFFMFFFQSLWVGVWVCVYREKIRKNGERTFISIFRSILIDALSLTFCLSFQKCFLCFFCVLRR